MFIPLCTALSVIYPISVKPAVNVHTSAANLGEYTLRGTSKYGMNKQPTRTLSLSPAAKVGSTLTTESQNDHTSFSVVDAIPGAVVSSRYGILYQAGSQPAEELLQKQVPASFTNWDGYRVVMDTPLGTSVRNISGVNVYGRNTISQKNHAAIRSQGSGGETNLIAYSSGLTCEVDGCSTWGLNPTLSDTADTRTLSQAEAYSAKLIGAEFDFSVRNPGTVVQALSFLGSSTVQPKNANGITFGSLGSSAQWNYPFVISDGVSRKGLFLGSQDKAGTPSSPSVPIDFSWYNRNSTRAVPSGGQIRLQAANGALEISDMYKPNGIALLPSNDGVAPSVIAQGKDADIDLIMAAKGRGKLDFRSEMSIDGTLKIYTNKSVTGRISLPNNAKSGANADPGAAITADGADGRGSVTFWNTFAQTDTSFIFNQLVEGGKFIELMQVGAHGVKVRAQTVRNLPKCDKANTDLITIVVDAKNPTYRGHVLEGGSERTIVECDGIAWTTH